MEQHPNHAPPAHEPAAPATLSPKATAQRAQWTPGKQRIFLAALLETGSVARAAQAAGMSRSSAHRLRQRFAGTPFDRTWDQVLALHASRMADPFGPDGAPPRQAARPGQSSDMRDGSRGAQRTQP